jgi:hypothetical protein
MECDVLALRRPLPGWELIPKTYRALYVIVGKTAILPMVDTM